MTSKKPHRAREAVINIRCTKAEKKALEAAAKAERRTLSNYMVNAGLEHKTT